MRSKTMLDENTETSGVLTSQNEFLKKLTSPPKSGLSTTEAPS